MEIVVCLKRTPDTTARVRPAAGGKSIDPAGIEWIINPYDELAIEQAVRTKERLDSAWWVEEIKRQKDRLGKAEITPEQFQAVEKEKARWEPLMPVYGKATVTAVMLDPEGNPTIMRKAMAMGVDKGIILQGGQTMDGLGVARALAEALSKIKFDLVFCGKQGIDDDNTQVPSMLAYFLKIPRAGVVIRMELGNGEVTAHRQIEGGEEVVALKLPCLISCQRGLNEPRFPSLKGIMDAKKKSLETVRLENFDAGVEILSIESPPARQGGRIVGNVLGQGTDEIRAACRELVRLLKEEAKVL
jgi:electron transfer flavoprotein beta subunit